jgi:hypothetical protein
LNTANCNLGFIATADIKVAGKSIRDVSLDIPSDEGKEKIWGYSTVSVKNVILPREIYSCLQKATV